MPRSTDPSCSGLSFIPIYLVSQGREYFNTRFGLFLVQLKQKPFEVFDGDDLAHKLLSPQNIRHPAEWKSGALGAAA